MIDIKDKTYQPDLAEIAAFVDNPLFFSLCAHLEDEYKALVSIEYSCDTVLLGWNVRFRKAGRTLIRLYPKREYFTVLVVVGNKERECVESLLPQMSGAMQSLYKTTPEGMGQRWLLIDLTESDDLYRDVLRLIAIRRRSK